MKRETLELGLLNLVSYFMLTWDIRTVSQGNIPYAVCVNMIIAILTFTIFKRMQEADKDWKNCTAYAVFGTVGMVLGILVSQHILGK